MNPKQPLSSVRIKQALANLSLLAPCLACLTFFAMRGGSPSFWILLWITGALLAVGGISSAAIIQAGTKHQRSAGIVGLVLNLLFGTVFAFLAAFALGMSNFN